MRPTCPVCDRPAALVRGAVIEVVEATVAGLLDQAPRLVCDAGHDVSAIPTLGLGAALVERCRGAVPRARRRRLRGDSCTSCGSALSMPVRRATRAVSVDGLGDLPVLTLRFDLPMTRCPSCGLDQVPSRSDGDLDHAVGRLAAGG